MKIELKITVTLLRNKEVPADEAVEKDDIAEELHEAVRSAIEDCEFEGYEAPEVDIQE